MAARCRGGRGGGSWGGEGSEGRGGASSDGKGRGVCMLGTPPSAIDRKPADRRSQGRERHQPCLRWSSEVSKSSSEDLVRSPAKRHLQNSGDSSEDLVRSHAKSCEALPPKRLHRQHQRPSRQMMASDSGPRNSRGIQL
ncbi:hypothetical protein PVAP13_3KG081381 [Panicum virgatum]|uniref:Uncharacterized protein n=1 Tax=Panicum virgatum TaxID=38727 RepID=A0A8T0UGP3_PANVG|nr:hypothetical protein PVAP13_3KG081381 [Panicum virgatum]